MKFENHINKRKDKEKKKTCYKQEKNARKTVDKRIKKKRKTEKTAETDMQDKKSTYRDIFLLSLGEILAAIVTVAVYFFVYRAGFSYKVFTGAILGAAVAVFNFAFLTFSVNRAVDKFIALRGSGEMDDDEAEKFAAEHVGEIQNAQKLSDVIRTFTLLGSLVLAFISKQFDVIATVVPLLLFRPILIISQSIVRKRGE